MNSLDNDKINYHNQRIVFEKVCESFESCQKVCVLKCMKEKISIDKVSYLMFKNLLL